MEFELRDDPWMQKMQEVSDGRDAEARVKLVRRRRAAEPIRRLQHQGLEPGAAEIGRTDETVMPAADDDGVIGGTVLRLFAHARTRALKSFRISRAALAPGAPITPPPGCVPEPHR